MIYFGINKQTTKQIKKTIKIKNMDTIIFKKVKKDNKITVKHNRKIKAKIYIKDNGYQLIINGLSWEKSNLNECYSHIIEIYSNMLNVLGFNNEIQII